MILMTSGKRYHVQPSPHLFHLHRTLVIFVWLPWKTWITASPEQSSTSGAPWSLISSLNWNLSKD